MTNNYSAYEIVMIVHELHQRGYEQLRLFPGMSPNGMCWRWFVYPKILMRGDNHFECRGDYVPFDCPFGSTGEAYPKDGRAFFTADQFLEKYKDMIALAKAEDSAYVE